MSLRNYSTRRQNNINDTARLYHLKIASGHIFANAVVLSLYFKPKLQHYQI